MFDCPVCHSTMEENLTQVTDCCGLELEDDDETCPGCGAKDPLLVEGEAKLICANCGYVE